MSKTTKTRSTDENESQNSVSLFVWFFRVVSWDGILPISIYLIMFFAVKFGVNRNIVDSLGLALPVSASCVRVVIGYVQISMNRCSYPFKGGQFIAFLMAVLLLAFLDTTIILSIQGQLPLGAQIEIERAFFFYFLLMIFVMFPGPVATARQQTSFIDDE